MSLRGREEPDSPVPLRGKDTSTLQMATISPPSLRERGCRGGTRAHDRGIMSATTLATLVDFRQHGYGFGPTLATFSPTVRRSFMARTMARQPRHRAVWRQEVSCRRASRSPRLLHAGVPSGESEGRTRSAELDGDGHRARSFLTLVLGRAGERSIQSLSLIFQPDCTMCSPSLSPAPMVNRHGVPAVALVLASNL
jgi:hypothetical protein